MPRANSRNTADSETSGTLVSSIGDLKFEAALAELEQIVQSMEEGRLPLEESLAAYQRGSDLLGHCQQQLSDAEQRIQILDAGALRDFDTNGGQAR